MTLVGGGRGTVPSYGWAARASGPEFSGHPGLRPQVYHRVLASS